MPEYKSDSKLNSHGLTFWNWPGAGVEAAEMFGLSHAVVVPPNSPRIIVGGQVGLKDDGKVPESIEEEVFEAFDHVEKALMAAGLGADAWEYVYKATFYFAGMREHPELGPAMGKGLAQYCKGTRPSVTGIGVEALFDPSFHVEIQVEAFLPPK